MKTTTEEKATLLKRISEINDPSVIWVVNDFLVEILDRSFEDDEDFKATLQQALEESERGEGRPHEEVMKEFRERYGIKK